MHFNASLTVDACKNSAYGSNNDSPTVRTCENASCGYNKFIFVLYGPRLPTFRMNQNGLTAFGTPNNLNCDFSKSEFRFVAPASWQSDQSAFSPDKTAEPIDLRLGMVSSHTIRTWIPVRENVLLSCDNLPEQIFNSLPMHSFLYSKYGDKIQSALPTDR